MALHTTAHNTGGTIKLANLTRRVGDLLQVTKLLTVFEVHESEYDALEAFRTGSLIVEVGRSSPHKGHEGPRRKSAALAFPRIPSCASSFRR